MEEKAEKVQSELKQKQLTKRPIIIQAFKSEGVRIETKNKLCETLETEPTQIYVLII